MTDRAIAEADPFACLPADPQVVQAGGSAYAIRPLTVGQLPAFTRALKPALPALNGLFASEAELGAEQIAGLVADHGDSLITAVAIALKAPRPDIEELDLVEFMTLLPAIIKVNADFFARSLRSAQAITEAVIGAGPTPSSH